MEQALCDDLASQPRSVKSIRREGVGGGGGGGGSNDMKWHYFSKLMTEQRRLGGTSCARKDNLVVRGEQPRIFLNLAHFNSWKENF